MKHIADKRVFGCSVLAVLASAGSYAQKLPDKPNFLIIFTDELSAESMSCNIGNKYLNTPNMDYLAKHGITFSNAYCANPLSVPSRSSMLTGRYPHELGIQSNEEKRIDPKEFPTFGKIFEKAGYETGFVGKWHVPYDEKDQKSHGFLYMKENKSNGVDHMIPGSAIKFLKTKRNKPFLLVASFIDPHNICEWARGEKLPDGEVGKPPSADQCPPLRPNHGVSKNESDIMQMLRASYQANSMFPVSGFTDKKWRQYIWTYYRMIEKVDGEIGKILSALRESGLDKNTIVIFLSDHGDCQGAHLWNQKTVFFEEASKVPFIISYYGLNPRKSDYLVQTGIDLMPTLCDLAGISLNRQLPGKSLKQIITTGSVPTDRKYIVVSDKPIQGDPVNGYKPQPEGRMLRNKNFKYWIYNEGKQRETLYDLENDPGEMVNLAQDPKFKSELENCRKELAEWALKYNDPYLKYMIK